MLSLRFSNQAALERIGEAAFTVLDQTGMVFQNETILRALEAWGARVDYAHQHATFPKQALAAFVEGTRAARREAPAVVPFEAPDPPYSGSVAQLVWDDALQAPRPGRREDLIWFLRLSRALEPDREAEHALILTEVPPLLEPLEVGLVMAEHAAVIGVPFTWNIRQIPYLQEMGHVLGYENWYSLGAMCMAHPLRFDQNVADRYVRMARDGDRHAGLASMPVAGVSAPVTLEGYVALTAAEFLASWIVGRALNPAIDLGGSMWAGTTDMQTGHVSYSSFDSMRYALAVFQFLRDWWGVTVTVGGGEYSASSVPGSYAALEKAYKAMTVAAFTGRHPSVGEGMVDNGKVLSAVQLLLDREFGLGVQHWGRTISATDDALALAEISEVGPGLSNHLATDHTARWFRPSLWLPHLLRRAGWTGPEDEAALLARCRAEADRLAAAAPVPEGREDLLAKLRPIVATAKADLLA